MNALGPTVSRKRRPSFKPRRHLANARDASWKWLDRAACGHLDVDEFFTTPGTVLPFFIAEMCRGCPVRLECVTHAYDRELGSGYFGGLSPQQRQRMTLDQAAALIANDPLRSL
jgi:hypothetical protein